MNEKERIEKKLKKKEKELKMITENKMLNIKISGIVKKRVSKIVEIPFEKNLSVAEYLIKIPKEKKDFINRLKKEFPKGSEINIEILNNTKPLPKTTKADSVAYMGLNKTNIKKN